MSLGRHQSRRLLVQIYAAAVARDDREPDEDTLQLALDGKTPSDADREFLFETLTLLRRKRPFLIRRLEKFLNGEKFGRLDDLSVIERAILMFAALEIVYAAPGITPPAVALHEAVELAKEFGGEKSPRLVNAVLRRLTEAEETREKKAKKPAAKK